MKLKKIAFLLDHSLKDYRLPFFEKLVTRGYDIDVFHSGKPLASSRGFKEIIVPEKYISGFIVKNISSFKSYEVVVVMQNIRMLNLWYMTLNPFKRYKIIHWGIGVSSAHGLSDKKTIVSRVRNYLSSFADSIILYSAFPEPLYSRKNWSKTLISHNTIENPLHQNFSNEEKNCFLFIGTLNKRKGLSILILAFKKYLENYPVERIEKLVIVGDGPEKKSLQELVCKLDIVNKVIFVGRLTKPIGKVEHFKRAVASISPKQAGLSVLESFSFGVPFIAYEDAISGGEHLNIVNDDNGFLIESEEELVGVMVRLDNDVVLSQRLGTSAYKHYISERSMENMVEVFVKAIEKGLGQ